MSGLLLLQLLTFSFTLWFGLYLFVRDSKKLGLRFAGLGLVTYALGLALTVLAAYFPLAEATATHWRVAPILLPSVLWMAATWFLQPETTSVPYLNGSRSVLLVAVMLLSVLVVALNATVAQAAVVAVPIVFLLIALLKMRQAFRSSLPRSPLVTLLVTTLFFMLATGLLIIPVEWLASELVLLAVSFDMILLGVVIGYVDAYEEGTNLLPDALRSLMASGISAALLGGQVGFLMIVSDSGSPFNKVLLFTVTATAIALETFSGKLQSMLDRIIFVDRPQVYQERTLLRSINDALPRTNPALAWRQLDEETFARLTRRALSHFNDLDKLAASPLTQLPVVTQRLRQQNKGDTVLERTHELKRLLAESILRLKPYSDQDFGTSDAWRYYNVLYFPYTVGLKPYSVRAQQDALDDAARSALDWFQTQVPERTLYNWQTTAARLVAQNLRELQSDISIDR